MSYVTRAMRQRAAADRREEQHGPDLVTMRVLDRQFADQAVKEREARFPVLDAENFVAATEFQNARIEALRATSEPFQSALRRVRGGQ